MELHHENSPSFRERVPTMLGQLRASLAAHPDQLAVVAQDGQLTFRQLDEASDQLASALAQRGFGPGQVCGLLLGRSKHVPVAMVAVLKLGGAFVSLLPEGPFDRNRRLLTGTRSRVLVSTAADLADTGREDDYLASWYVLDAASGDGRGQVVEHGEPSVPADSAYVVFTSGSTGEPKGAINYTRSLLNLVEGLRDAVYQRHGAGLRIAVVAPFVFDPSVQQIFAALLLGHTMYIVPEDARLEGRGLLRFLRQHRIQIADGTPTHLRLLAEADVNAGALPELERLLIGGEALTGEVVARFVARFGPLGCPAITNLYGLAECAVDSVSHEVDLKQVDREGVVPIGRPMRGTQIYLLRQEGGLAESGEVGELYVGGEGVGAGYVGSPEATSERFAEHPWAPGQHLYRTGDLARRLETGELVYVGRVDRQLKLAGRRIEPGEIEAVMRKFVSDDVVRLASSATPKRQPAACQRCVLDERYPGVTIEDGVCSDCRWFELHREKLDAYFCAPEHFEALVRESQERPGASAHDCLLLYSGGKDSSYVLHKLIEAGHRIATFTFDNGFISDTALRNIERVAKRYGIDHTTVSLPQMNEVFRASLSSRSTTCDGCFRALTAVSTRLARERGIRVVITGLSRGQIMETKLKPLFASGVSDVEERLHTYRKLYSTRADAIGQALGIADGDGADGDGVADDLHYVDYFRYDAASRSEVMAYLRERDEHWRAPRDTGLCSTNCRVNDVGIYVHQAERGFHNYGRPLSWDCRLGVISRDEAFSELGHVEPGPELKSMLVTIGYKPRDRVSRIRDAMVVSRIGPSGRPVLCGYYVSSEELDQAALRAHLASELPAYMVPQFLLRIDAIPLHPNGKVDVSRLPSLELVPEGTSDLTDEGERRLGALWREVLGLPRIGAEDNFFDLGGESLTASLLVELIEAEYGVALTVVEAFRRPTLRAMALSVAAASGSPS